MAVMLKCGAVFLHIPKTGGSWVTHVLKQQGLVRKEFGHIHADMVRVRYYTGNTMSTARNTWEWAKSVVPRSWKAMPVLQRVKHDTERARQAKFPFCFCFVRHPLGWYESWWRYMCGRSGTDWAGENDLQSWHPCGILRDTGDPNFSQFVRNVNQKRPGFVTELYSLYTQEGIDFVGTQERLVDDLIVALQQLNVRFDEQRLRESRRVNSSRQQEFPIQWDPAVREETLRCEYAGLARFHYPLTEEPHGGIHVARKDDLWISKH